MGEGRGQLGARQGCWIFFLCLACLKAEALGVSLVFSVVVLSAALGEEIRLRSSGPFTSQINSIHRDFCFGGGVLLGNPDEDSPILGFTE